MSHKRAFIVLILLVIASGVLFWKIGTSTNPILISNVQAIVPDNHNGTFPIYMTLENTGGADTLIDVESQIGGSAMVMGSSIKDRAFIPAGSKPSFSSDGTHIMLSEIEGDLNEGSFVPLSLIFKNAGAVPVKAMVKRLDVKSMDMSTKSGSETKTNTMNHTIHGADNSFEIEAGDFVPAVFMKIIPTAQNNEWRIIIRTDKFEFVKSSEMLKHRLGQGHAHLYLNGLKLQRVYGDEAIIGALPKGQHTVRITLNTNDHRTYSVQGNSISVQQTITVD